MKTNFHSEQDVLLFDKLSSIFSLFVPSEIIQLGLYSKLGDFQFYFQGHDLPSHCTIGPKLTKAWELNIRELKLKEFLFGL